MDIMELGAIGELVGGVAVIGSLIFVGFQIRSSQRTASTAAQNAWIADYNALLTSMRGDPHWMSTFRRAVADFNSLSNNDQARVHVFLAAHLLNGSTVFHAARNGQFDPSLANAFVNFCAVMIKSPGIGEWWRWQREIIDKPFADYVDDLVARASLPRLDEAFPWYALEPEETAEA